jgi:hypothetical protein
MRLLLIQGDYVGIYEDRKQLAVFAGALQLSAEDAEYFRNVSRRKIQDALIEEKVNEAPQS